MPLTIADFPPEIQSIIDPLKPTPTREGTCPSEQPVCNPDSRVTAQLDDRPLEARLLPWRISNAEKGHLLMTPGGPGGLIGGLLARLVPPQFFSHMGIMVQDHTEIRHATASMQRMKRFPHRAGTITAKGSSAVMDFIGLDEINDTPTDGFQEDALRFAWPGTITQTVEQAYMSWAQPTAASLGYPDQASRDAYLNQFKIKDDTSGESLHIGALTFSPEWVLTGGTISPCAPTDADAQLQLVWPLIVKPCDLMENEWVRNALNRVAEAARELRGHYRFFAYTRADVGLDPSRTGPVMTEPFVFDPHCPNLKVHKTKETFGMVCSTFIWLAVDLVNKRANPAADLPRIILDGRPQGRVPAVNRCKPDLPIATTVDKFTSATPDGLYEYSKDERVASGQWLYDYIHDCEVIKEIEENTDLQKKLDGIFSGSSTAWTIWKIAKLLMMFSPVQVGLILGVSSEMLEFLVRLLSDMPDDVAQQVANAFGSDDCTVDAKDSTAWKDSPGTGMTVSPDNIVRSWAPPTHADREGIHGIYGHNVKAKLEPPEYEEFGPPPSIWKISQGFGVVKGSVHFKGVGVEGARVRIGCKKLRSIAGGAIRETNVPSGRYWATAWWQDPDSGLVLESSFLVNKKTGLPFNEASDPPDLKAVSKGRAIEISAGGGAGLIIDLEEPPDNKRCVWLEGHMDNVNRYAIGKDWWDHPRFTRGPFLMGDLYLSGTQYDNLRKAASHQEPNDVSFQIDDWGQSQITLVFDICGDLDTSIPQAIRHRTIKVHCKARLKEIEDDDWQYDETFYVLPKANNSDPGETKVIDMVRSEMAWPVRSHIEFTIHNDRR